MRKLVEMIRNLARYVRNLFRGDSPPEFGKDLNGGRDREHAAMHVPYVSNGEKEFTKVSSREFPRSKKKRGKRGIKFYAPMAKMTFDEAEKIRELIGCGAGTIAQAMRAYDVSGTCIRNILERKTYQFPRPRTLPKRWKACERCGKNIEDRIDGERIHPERWEVIRFCGSYCATHASEAFREFRDEMTERFKKGPL